MPQLVDVLPNSRIDEQALAAFMTEHLGGARTLDIHQFQGGQSNPTYHVRRGDAEYVLRKRPRGTLLPGAHAINREFAVQQALKDSDVPVAEMILFCEDESILGEAFYLMEHVPGRVFTDRLLGGCSVAERAAIYDSMNQVLAALHNIDFRSVGLEGFGRADTYVARQVSRWSRNYRASQVRDLPVMQEVITWLEAHVPADDQTTIVHGDYRIGNLVFHPAEPRVVAVLDWELSTIGHPLADLAYNCLPWRLPTSTQRGFADEDFRALGIPSEADYVEAYRRRRGGSLGGDWRYFLTFAMFRSAAILAGVYRRALDGNASDARGLMVGQLFETIAHHAWETASDGE
ncbi:phosphotransferase family protein [Sphingomonas jinjuensis]|nr:phosphotransferase family protein [Sphingomonas jinjuensis]